MDTQGRANEILRKRIKELEGYSDPEKIRKAIVAGLQLYFEHHPSATKENIGSMVKRIDQKLKDNRV